MLHRHPHVKRLVVPVLVLLPATACTAFAAGFVNPVLLVVDIVALLVIFRR